MQEEVQTGRFEESSQGAFQDRDKFTLKESVSIAILFSVITFAVGQILDSIDEGAPIQLMAPFLELVIVLIIMIPFSFAKKPIAFLVPSAIYVIADIGTAIAPGTPWQSGWNSLFNLTYLVYYAISSYAIYNNIAIYKRLAKMRGKRHSV